VSFTFPSLCTHFPSSTFLLPASFFSICYLY
jgi:hypothetical protein